ncbi:MAG: hypothetical protein AAGF12_26020 [Myxococcota bacterium]
MTPTLRFAATAALLVGGCAATEGQIVPLDVVLEPTPDRQFTTNIGWEVELDEAYAAIGPIHLYSPAEEPSAMAVLEQLVGPSVARAHGGTDPLNGRRVRAEWLTQVAFDVIGTRTRSLGTVDAETGAVESASVTLDPPVAQNSETLRGHQLWVRGRAMKDGVTIPFEGGLDIEGEGLARRVENLTIDGLLEPGMTWRVTVHAFTWFEDAHFDRLTEQTAEGTYVITPQDQVAGAWFLNVRAPSGYHTTLGRN